MDDLFAKHETINLVDDLFAKPEQANPVDDFFAGFSQPAKQSEDLFSAMPK